jgi:hypothetical protein
VPICYQIEELEHGDISGKYPGNTPCFFHMKQIDQAGDGMSRLASDAGCVNIGDHRYLL